MKAGKEEFAGSGTTDDGIALHLFTTVSELAMQNMIVQEV